MNVLGINQKHKYKVGIGHVLLPFVPLSVINRNQIKTVIKLRLN